MGLPLRLSALRELSWGQGPLGGDGGLGLRLGLRLGLGLGVSWVALRQQSNGRPSSPRSVSIQRTPPRPSTCAPKEWVRPPPSPSGTEYIRSTSSLMLPCRSSYSARVAQRRRRSFFTRPSMPAVSSCCLARLEGGWRAGGMKVFDCNRGLGIWSGDPNV